jgi:hypothetical protein
MILKNAKKNDYPLSLFIPLPKPLPLRLCVAASAEQGKREGLKLLLI